MGEKTNKIIERILLGLAAFSFVVAFIEGILFYSAAEYPNIFIRYMLIIENTLRAFVFEPSIRIEDVIEILKSSTSKFITVFNYIYLAAIFIAPYCTLSFGYKFLKRVFCIGKKHYFKKYDGIIIFGYNDEIKNLLDDYHKNKKDNNYRIHLINADISSDEEIQLLLCGVIVHKIDCLKRTKKQLKSDFSQMKLKRAKHIILFDESAAKNFSLYKMFHEEKEIAKLNKDVKFLCRCENRGIMNLIEEFHDSQSEFDMETISIPELRVRNTLKKVPLHKYYESKPEVPVGKWDMHLLIVGFGKMGQQVLLQSMNQGVVSSTNKMLVDVVDYDIENKSSIFANVFDEDYVQIEKEQITISSDKADGELMIRFHQMDIRYKQFFTLLKEYGSGKEHGNYTYVAICIEDEEVGVHCLTEVQRYIRKCVNVQDQNNIGIVIRMEMNKYMREYLSNNDKTFKNVDVIEGNDSVITLGKLIRDELDNDAKEYNRIYKDIRILDGKDIIVSEDDHKDINKARKELWRDIKLVGRESNRALAEHAEIKEVVWKQLMKGEDPQKYLQHLFGEKGVVIRKQGEIWRYDNEDMFVEKQSNQKQYPILSEMSRMEHRRWCYFMACRGWSSGQEGDEKLDKTILEQEKRNISLCNWSDLVRLKKENCKYDMVWLLRKYDEITLKGEEI